MVPKKLTDFKEEDLYEPLRKWLINKGYAVQAEVKSCDVVAQKDGQLTIVELKKSFNLQLVYQCLERQKLAPLVYAGIANPIKGKRNKNINRVKMLLRRLGIGLIIINLYERSSLIEIALEAKPSGIKKNPRKKKRVLDEISKRSGEYNQGGRQGKIITAYREAAIHIYCLLQKEIEASPAQLIKLGAPKNTGAILRDNHYGWFYKISRGKYTFDIDLEEIKKDYQEVFDFFEGNS